MELKTSISYAVSELHGALFRDPDCPLGERVRDLIERLSLAEKIGQLADDAPAIPRLGIPAYHAWSEGLHGVASNGRATVFPQVIGMAATWDAELARRVGAAIGDEARAKYHEALRSNGGTRIYQGLHLRVPDTGIYRDPRWSRGQETWGEDPLLASLLGAAFVRGLEGDHPHYLKVAARAGRCAFHHWPEQALARGLIAEADIDRALARGLATRFKLGMFDPPERVPYAATPPSVVSCPAHWELAYQAAAQSVVLLKNRDGVLPLGPQARGIGVLGPTAADVGVLLGSDSGLSAELTTILEGIVDRAPEDVRLDYWPGDRLPAPGTPRYERLFGHHARPDVLIACVGLSPLDDERGDRADIALPAEQAELVRGLAATGAKLVLVLTGGGPIALGDLAELADAIVFAWYPGQAGGAAVADVLFGQVVPSGKLPVTFPRSVADLPPLDGDGAAGWTDRYAAHEPLYPFGFGLSYTSFAYRDLRLDRECIAAGTGMSFGLMLANTGSDVGEEVVQVYLSALDTPGAPLSSLIGFRRIELCTGEQQTIRFEIAPARLMPGRYRLTVGGCSPGERGIALGAPAPVSAEFTVE